MSLLKSAKEVLEGVGLNREAEILLRRTQEAEQMSAETRRAIRRMWENEDGKTMLTWMLLASGIYGSDPRRLFLEVLRAVSGEEESNG